MTLMVVHNKTYYVTKTYEKATRRNTVTPPELFIKRNI